MAIRVKHPKDPRPKGSIRGRTDTKPHLLDKAQVELGKKRIRDGKEIKTDVHSQTWKKEKKQCKNFNWVKDIT